MCLTQRFNKTELAKFKKSLPEEFPVWKMGQLGDGGFMPEYKAGTEPILERGIHKAGSYRYNRVNIGGKYKPGFHAFLTRYCARKYQNGKYSTIIKKFYAKRSWITAAGKSLYDDKEYPHPIVVLSHIELRG
jgi:hypothetical protein